MKVQREWIRVAVLYVVTLAGWSLTGLSSALAEDIAPISEEIEAADAASEAPARQPAKTPATSPRQPAKTPATSPSQPAKTPATSPSQPAKTPEASEDSPEESDQTGGEGEDLLMFEDIPVVISASRQKTEVKWLSIPTSIITADDIHYSGLTNIPELLRFVPGMDVMKVDRWRYNVGIRGMADVISDRMLTLIDGRDATNLVTGGTEFYRFPILMEDIKQIEVVRGPGGGAWGANAMNGVINVITKDPEDCLGYFASTTWSNYGDSYNQVRWAAKEGKWSWRLSTGYEDDVSSEDALHHAPQAGFFGTPPKDYFRSWRFDDKFIYQLSDETKLSFGSNYSVDVMGPTAFIFLNPSNNGRMETSRSFIRSDTKLDSRSDLSIQWYTNYYRTNQPAPYNNKGLENDLEIQYNLRTDHHTITLGTNGRWVRINDDAEVGQVQYSRDPYDEYWAGLWGIDRWQVTDRFVVEAQLRGDNYSKTHPDWSARLTGLYALDEAKHHVVRLSGAKAFRAPLSNMQRGQIFQFLLPTPFFPPNTYLLNHLKPFDKLKNEETASIELGYTGELTEYLTFRTNAYFQRYDRLINYDAVTGVGLPFQFVTITNQSGGANAWGVENELELKGKPGSLSAWYAYNGFWPDNGPVVQGMRMSYMPAPQKVGITGRLNLPWDMVLNTDYRFTCATPALSGGADYPITHNLDIALSKPVKMGSCEGEFMIGVNDVFHHRYGPVNCSATAGHDTPGRTFFARFQIKF